MNVVKSGFLSKFTNSFSGDRWENRWCVLKKDSSFEWFDKQTDSRPKRVVLLKSVCSFLAVGNYARHVPNHPVLGAGHNQHMIIAIPHTASRESKVAFFEASSQQELEEWMTAISSTLPPPPKPHDPVLSQSHPDVVQPTTASTQSSPYPSAPPAAGYPGAAPGYPGAAPGYPGGAPGYPPQPGPMPIPGGHGSAPPPPYQPNPYPQAGPGGPVGFTVGPGPYPQAPHQPYQPPHPQPGPSNYPVQAPAAYPQQAGGVYPQQGYPQQPPVAGGYGQPAAYGAMAGAVAAPYGTQVVIPKKKKKKGKYKKAALGLAGGAAAGYVASKVIGGGWGLGHGWGHRGSWGSWSSGSFGSWSSGSFGSFGSFGS